MIKFLAEIFRGFHYIIGISEPPPNTSDRTIALVGLGIIAFVVAFGLILFRYVIPLLYVAR